MCALAAKECSSTSDLVGKLVEFGFTSSTETRSFAADIYTKVPRRASGISVSLNFAVFFVYSIDTEGNYFIADKMLCVAQNYQKQEREAAQLVRKQSTYQLLADDDDNDADNQTSTSRQILGNQSSKSRKHFRKKAEDQDGGDDDDDVRLVWYDP